MGYNRERQHRPEQATNHSSNESHLAPGAVTLVETQLGPVQRKATHDRKSLDTAPPRSVERQVSLEGVKYVPGETADAFRDVVEGIVSVQRSPAAGAATISEVEQHAAAGVSGAGGTVPHVAQMETAFGTSFADVSAHTGPEAAAACDALGAHAYATGSSIAFKMASPSLDLVAHELTHVLQQRSGVQAKGAGESSALEREADDVGARVARGESVLDVTKKYGGSVRASSYGVQRKGNDDAGETKASAGPTADAANPATEVVTMDWNVDYQDTAGKIKGKMHDRYGDDQMIVRELKIDPDGKEKPRILRGGNMAVSGDVYLGQVTVPKGSGKVTAAVHYAKKKDFTVALDVTPKPKGTAGTQLLQKATKQAQEAVMSMINDDGRGDYDTMAKEVETELASMFEGASVQVLIKPLGKGKAGDLYVADGAPYTVDENSEWAALIDPTGSSTNAVNWSTSSTEDEKSGESEEDGAKVHTDIDTATKVKEAEKYVQSFNESVKVNVQRVVKLIEEDIVKADSNETKTHTKETEWTVGVGTADKKDGDSAQKSGGGGGIGGKIKRGITGAAKWLFNKGKGLVKKIPIIGTALDIAGSIWDKLTGKVEIKRTSTESESETKGKGTSVSLKDAHEIDDMTSIARDLSTTFTAEASKEVETMVSTKFGVEFSKTKKKDSSSGKSTTKGSSGSTVTVETGQPKVFIKRLK